MQIGRVTGLREPTQFSQADAQAISMSVLCTGTQARQLLGHAENRAERFVPIIFGGWGDEHDGLYELVEVSVDHSPDLDAASLREVSITARAENRGRQVANSVILLRGDNRNRVANVGVTGPLYRAAVPSGATTIFSFNAGPSGFVVGSAVPTLGRNSIVRLTDDSQIKTSVARATTVNITLSGTVSVDGANAANNSRVLVKNQTTSSQNGIYVVNTGGAWTRATDANGGTELDRAVVYVESGTVNAGTTWQQPASGITIGTTAQTWQSAPTWGLRESSRGGPISISYKTPISGYYDGACTITQDNVVLTGTTILASPTPIMDNGLVKIDGTKAYIASGSPLAWKTEANIAGVALAPDGSVALISPADPTVVVNSADVATLRYRIPESFGVAGTLDLSIMRGSRTITAALNLNVAASAIIEFSTGSGFTDVTASGVGYTSPSLHLKVQSSDVESNRWGISTSAELSAVTGRTVTSSKSHAFGFHGIVGGGTTHTGDEQLFGMDRAWYAMLSQQTSAGVL